MKNENLKPLKVEELTKSEMGQLSGGFLVVAPVPNTKDLNIRCSTNTGCTVNNTKKCNSGNPTV